MSRLRDRNTMLQNHAIQARRRLERRDSLGERYSPEAVERDLVAAGRHPAPTVVALLFAPPDTHAMRMLDARGQYFDFRTGDIWDLFFPGYFRSKWDEEASGARLLGFDYGRDWYFNAHDFELMRRDVERRAGGRWTYSGEADLVLVGGWLPDAGDPIVDWKSVLSGELLEPLAAPYSIGLAKVIERITRDIETQTEDAAYGVRQVVEGQPQVPRPTLSRDMAAQVLVGIATSLGSHGLGLS